MSFAELHDALRALPARRDDQRPARPLRDQLFEVLSRDPDVDPGTPPARTEEALAAMEPCLMFVWCDDMDGVSLAAIPEAEISAELNTELDILGSTMFVGAEDFAPRRFAALLRVMACVMSPLSVEHGHAEELMPWIENDTAGWSEADRALLPDVAELRALDGRWARFFHAELDLDRRYARVIAIRKTC